MTEVWLVDVERSAPVLAEVERDRPRLTPQDVHRANAISDPHERGQRLAIMTALRILLERLAGPHTARGSFVTGLGGKPELADGGIRFSVSDVEGYALIGLTRSGEIGVDLERDRPLRISARRSDELMAAAKGLAGRPLAGASPTARFLQAWCRLEAFAKARGHGLGRTLTDLGLRSGLPRTAAQIEGAAGSRAREAGLCVHDMALESGLYAAVALEKAVRLRVQRLPTDREGIERLLEPRWASLRPRG
jgi:4'-phosphopantetheinyl transferase